MILDKSREISLLHGTICDLVQDIEQLEKMLKAMLDGAGACEMRMRVTDGNEVVTTKKKKRFPLPFMDEYDDIMEGYVEEEEFAEYVYSEEPNEEFTIHLLRSILEYKKYREQYYTNKLKRLL
jgi:hypothetical protein